VINFICILVLWCNFNLSLTAYRPTTRKIC
jgi:hypothetical protein